MIFAPQKGDIEGFKKKLKNQYLFTTILLDTCGSFIKENPFIAKKTIYHTFLVDKNEKIILIGNPCKNDKIEKKLMQIINKRKSG